MHWHSKSSEVTGLAHTQVGKINKDGQEGRRKDKGQPLEGLG